MHPNLASWASIRWSVVRKGVFLLIIQMFYAKFMSICNYAVIGQSIEESCDHGCVEFLDLCILHFF